MQNLEWYGFSHIQIINKTINDDVCTQGNSLYYPMFICTSDDMGNGTEEHAILNDENSDNWN